MVDSKASNISSETNKVPQCYKPKVSFFSYLRDELKRDYLLQQNEKKLMERRKRVYTFVKTPKELEKFLLFGFLLCFDVFLFVFTFLPIRILFALFTAVKRLLFCNRGNLVEPAQKIDLMKGLILALVSIVMVYVDTSVIYHVVRVQSIIKLYVVYNMLDMADKLLSSFGQDVLDALYWTVAEPRGRKREHVGIIPDFILSFIYVTLHTILNLLQVIVLNVALNSYNKALLTIMISNQFIEIKSSVFKRFEKNNLFQISCSDARERFHNVTLLLVVAMRNLTEYEWNLDYACSSFIPFAAVVIGSEFLVDWFKHAFITKFNDIQPDVYLTYRAFLAKNLLVNNCDTVFSGHTDQVSRRMGFTVLPMAALLIRICSQCIKLSNWSGLLFIILFYLCLCALKFIVSIHILGKSVQYVKEQDIKEKPFEPCWSFSPLSSVQEIHGGFNSDTKLFTSSVPEA
ncbi:transmembrane anterior posterior transformation protein 1 homolog isoform X1 [Hydra vulgaris]|uniref:transmembrane anterior posterior transformation protein 1 homolog isoform X1 n=1 Tax=Hydra vulgaris TaxID=6087 RepID=UPI000640F320|nr:transmembrane anterior posterior transformation protein 1 homolog isoform X1 [Hydra vulgaris]XP_047128951.1 transmembrane anterior posterior transformation protein 1 homolog isoform X1 [Hydra vulgaris]XP_047128952.1 transmembrane anterior posterior transformation protein 1 homolog isoform X1 [Hydra vulgaris]